MFSLVRNLAEANTPYVETIWGLSRMGMPGS